MQFRSISRIEECLERVEECKENKSGANCMGQVDQLRSLRPLLVKSAMRLILS